MRTVSPLTDQELAANYQAGDEQALEVLIERYRRFARSKARGYFLVGADADDVEQEALIGLYKAARDYRTGHFASFRAFAELCITRQIITAIKAATRQKHQPLNRAVPMSAPRDGDQADETDLDLVLAAPDSDPWVAVEAAARMDALRTLLSDRLSPLEVEVVSLYVDGHSYQSIGDELGRPEKSIDNALQRIKRKLGPELAPVVASVEPAEAVSA